ncbi:unnamed protein product, partial [Laminaria digitata]
DHGVAVLHQVQFRTGDLPPPLIPREEPPQAPLRRRTPLESAHLPAAHPPPPVLNRKVNLDLLFRPYPLPKCLQRATQSADPGGSRRAVRPQRVLSAVRVDAGAQQDVSDLSHLKRCGSVLVEVAQESAGLEGAVLRPEL